MDNNDTKTELFLQSEEFYLPVCNSDDVSNENTDERVILADFGILQDTYMVLNQLDLSKLSEKEFYYITGAMDALLSIGRVKTRIDKIVEKYSEPPEIDISNELVALGIYDTLKEIIEQIEGNRDTEEDHNDRIQDASENSPE